MKNVIVIFSQNYDRTKLRMYKAYSEENREQAENELQMNQDMNPHLHYRLAVIPFEQ